MSKDNMEQIKNLFNKFGNLMEQNIKGVKIGCYSVALVGLTIAIRRVRPFTRFKRPSDIPNRFILERRELTGTVERIEPSGALLMVRHKPLVPFPLISEGTLPVKLSGINVTGHGISWLQTIVAGQEIKFIPVLKEKDWVQCEVRLDQQTHNKKLRTINVGESLTSVGFGITVPIQRPLDSSLEYKDYYKRLQVAEAYAIRKKLGIKYYIKPTKSALTKLGKKVGKLFAQSPKPSANVPKLAVA